MVRQYWATLLPPTMIWAKSSRIFLLKVKICLLGKDGNGEACLRSFPPLNLPKIIKSREGISICNNIRGQLPLRRVDSQSFVQLWMEDPGMGPGIKENGSQGPRPRRSYHGVTARKQAQ